MRRSGNGSSVKTQRRPIAVDLFAGVGGFALGFEQAGFDVAACVEYDPIHAAVHSFNFPRTEVLCTDMATVSPQELKKAIRTGCAAHGRNDLDDPRVDVVIGGPPCQGFSVGGKLKFDDERNRLVFAFARAVGIIQPRYFVMENVPAIRHATNVREGDSAPTLDPGSLLNALFSEFDRLGYDICEEEILNARDYGVPQDRRRLILIGVRRGGREAALPEANVVARPKRADGASAKDAADHESELPLGPSVAEAISDLPDLDQFEDLLTSDAVKVAANIWDLQDASSYAKFMHGSDVDPLDLSYPRSTANYLLTSSLRTTHSSKTVERFEATTPGSTEPVSRFYRLDPDGLCNTLRAGTGYERGSFSAPRPIHPTYARVISVREAARLQSFPDWFRLHVTKWHGFRQVGNALPPLLARALGRAIIEALQAEVSRPKRSIALGDPECLQEGMTIAARRFNVPDGSAPTHATRSRKRARAATSKRQKVAA